MKHRTYQLKFLEYQILHMYLPIISIFVTNVLILSQYEINKVNRIYSYIEFKVPTMVTMKSTIYCDVMQCGPTVHQRFGRMSVNFYWKA
jgi:hypothetical protein